MNILMAQLNSELGAVWKNLDKLEEVMEYSSETDGSPDLLILPPFFISGCPLGGLEFSEGFLRELDKAHDKLAEVAKVPVLTTSYVTEYDEETGSVLFVDEKICLFRDGSMTVLEDQDDMYSKVGDFTIGGKKFVVLLGGTDAMLEAGEMDVPADAIVNLVDDTYDIQRADLVSGDEIAANEKLAESAGAWVLRCGCVGAQGPAVYPGASYIVTPEGEMGVDAVLFDEALLGIDILEGEDEEWVVSVEELDDDRDFGFSVHMDDYGIDDEMADWGAIVTGTRDYVLKSGMTDVVVGLSGGIDSAVVAAIAVDALGPHKVHGVLMPARYSSDSSVSDSEKLVELLGIDSVTIPIEGPFEAFEKLLAEPCGGSVEGSVRDNLQPRVRSVCLMALSNRYGWVMLNTSNKSEAAMGYSTIYGDTCGAYAPIGNVYKTRVYELARWRNEQSEVIPEEIIEKAPSAELHEGQKDQDSLPPYEILDGICTLYLEYDYTPDAIVDEGFDRDTVNKVLRTIASNEFKRAVEPMGPWVDGISFKDDRNWPVVNGYHDESLEDETPGSIGE